MSSNVGASGDRPESDRPSRVKSIRLCHADQVSSVLFLLVDCFALNAYVAADPVTFEILGNSAYPTDNFTTPSAITDGGDIAGYFDDNSGTQRGFVRYREWRIWYTDCRF